MEELEFGFNQLIVHPDFRKSLQEIKDMHVKLPDIIPYEETADNGDIFARTGELVEPVGKIEKVKLDAADGGRFINGGAVVAAYDESFMKFNSLEGTAYFTAHAIVLLMPQEYIPSAFLTFRFYTRSKEIAENSKHITEAPDPHMAFLKDYIRDRIDFLTNTVPEESIMLIDGPLIGGDVYTIMIQSIKEFTAKNIVPIFFVKNSSSNLVTDNVKQLKDKYNSDMHWSYDFLSAGERTTFFRYADRNNPKNAKVFCYVKAFMSSPQRLEMYVDTYEKHKSIIPGLLDMVYYLLLAQGDKQNPQVRPIVIAEKYARETLRLVNVNKLMRRIGITPTINQIRGFGG